MKVILLTIVGLLIVSITAQENQLSDDEFMKKIDECQQQENATKADAETIANHNLPETEGAQCIAACMMEATGVVSGANEPSIYYKMLDLNFNSSRREKSVKTISRN